MVKCCISGCGVNHFNKPSQVSFHRIPSKEDLKAKWLSAIGKKNIVVRAKKLFVCSLHFTHSCFNRTMDVVRLRDNAVPTLFLKGKSDGSAPSSPSTSDEDVVSESHTSIVGRSSSPNLDHDIETLINSSIIKKSSPVNSNERSKDSQSHSTVIENLIDDLLEIQSSSTQKKMEHSEKPQPSGTAIVKSPQNSKNVPSRVSSTQVTAQYNKLRALYVQQFKLIKRLNQKSRRQMKKIADFSATVSTLRKKIILEERKILSKRRSQTQR